MGQPVPKGFAPNNEKRPRRMGRGRLIFVRGHRVGDNRQIPLWGSEARASGRGGLKVVESPKFVAHALIGV